LQKKAPKRLIFLETDSTPGVRDVRGTSREGNGDQEVSQRPCPAATGAMEMAPQTLGKIYSGDGNGAVGGCRMKGLRHRRDEGTDFGA
jgi:hypothetical protein